MASRAAPGRLELVRAFVNTRDVERDTEELAAPADLAAWLAGRDLGSASRASSVEHRRAVALREALRACLLAHHDDAPPPPAATGELEAAARRARLSVTFDGEGRAGARPLAGGVDGALGQLLAIVHVAQAEGTWERLKACPAETCQWAFYDASRNRSARWCTMEVCGNRAKARGYRARTSR